MLAALLALQLSKPCAGLLILCGALVALQYKGFTECRPGHILYVDDMNLDLLQHIDDVRSIMHMLMHIACTFENIDAP